MDLTTSQYLLGAVGGGVVGLTLGLVGGGGSILAVPLMAYLVGIADPHVAIGTSALAVAVIAAFNLAQHARKRNVKWRCAATFAAAGVAGAYLGSVLGRAIDGQKLLALFALLMLVVAALMFRSRGAREDPTVVLNRGNATKLLASGGATGFLSGFFGIGGGFLVVPGLIASTGMPVLFAVGSSLVAVTAFGLTTAMSYAAEGLVSWTLAGVFVAGGAVGGFFGERLARRMSSRKGLLNLALSALIVIVASYMLYRTAVAEEDPARTSTPSTAGVTMDAFRQIERDVFTGGQPTPEDLSRLASNGVKTVINLRAPNEPIGFDEAAKVARLGMQYRVVTIADGSDLTRAKVSEFGRAVEEARAEGPVLIHCGSGNRVGAAIALSEGWNRGRDAESALAAGRAAGLAKLEPEVVELLSPQQGAKE